MPCSVSVVRGGPCKAVNFGDFPNTLGMELLLLFSLTVFSMGFRLRLSWEGEWDVVA